MAHRRSSLSVVTSDQLTVQLWCADVWRRRPGEWARPRVYERFEC